MKETYKRDMYIQKRPIKGTYDMKETHKRDDVFVCIKSVCISDDRDTVCCCSSVLQCVAVCCSVMPCVAVSCSKLR